MPQLFLGVDGGGTGCRAAVAAAQGGVLGAGSAASANIVSDPSGARDNILIAAQAALDASGAGGDLTALHAVLGLAGANVGGAAARLTARLPFARTHVASDAVTALRGAFGQGDGIAATLGTGSVFAVRRAGAVRVIGGWGFVLGDHAGGAWMGRALLDAALRAHDGLLPASPLLDAALESAGGPEALVEFAHAARPADFARYAPQILEAEAAGDAAAVAILRRAEAQVSRAIDRLQCGGALPVCFLGGLGPVFAARLQRRYAGLIRAPEGSALDGALAMARSFG